MNFLIETEGVLILCSSKGIKQRYATESFNYDFPEGLIQPINSGELIAIVAESGDDVKVEVSINMEPAIGLEKYTHLPSFKIEVRDKDRLFFLSHAEFTQICDGRSGDISRYIFYDDPKYVNELEPGWYIVDIYGRVLDNEELEGLCGDESHDILLYFCLSKQDSEPVIKFEGIPSI